jgi:hypothetical protein
MSDQVVVFAPTRVGDEALVRTRWIAGHTIAMLRDENIEPVPVLDGEATRARLESSAAGPVCGLALLSHGRDSHIGSSGSRSRATRDDAILGADGAPALTRNLARGVRDVRALKAHAEAIAEDISAWCMDHADQAEGLEATAHQLVARMCCFPP